ncbi:undecaprenyl-diphosphate phosphatase [Agrobacterium sp. rho-13.3]|uniref:undecaprenyl-diphosphate phosphatase n=1 Tax=Agrobacterium sp. rho-13.3 TaxID=3072980 RepID=UPI002A1755FA|nr:undecaprenyl-diphosphate phosphatase [Agrobacterium sp. rho-13.3]MDX8308835.1 undecaprenyl-diphosphate phosphatase [Agrobacterium sp. rho-13.3]
MTIGWIEAAILGFIQGLTEFLPISSSAHLRIAGEFMSSADPGAAFTAIIQIGTELAVLVYFWSDIMRIATAWLRQNLRLGAYDQTDARMGWMIIVGSIPIVLLGLLFKDAIEHSLRNLYITAIMLIVFGIVLGFADRIGQKKYPIKKLIWRDAVLFGFAQAMALIPGVSRSGGTITAGLLLGYTREAAARYSFLLAIPAVFGSGFYQLFKSIGQENPVGWGPTALATVISFFVGYAVIVFFLKLVSTKSYLPFVYYRVVLGAVLLVLLSTGVISAGG